MRIPPKDRKYAALLVAVVLAMLAVEYMSTEPIDWRHTFSKGDKIPFGTGLLYERLADLFPQGQLSVSNQTIYEWAETGELYDFDAIVMVNDEINFSEPDRGMLLDWVHSGGRLWIAANELGRLSDTLGWHVPNTLFPISYWMQAIGEEDIDSAYCHSLSFSPAQRPCFREGLAEGYFSQIASESGPWELIDKVYCLGRDEDSHPVFLHFEVGDGHIYLHSSPLLFTNYNLLTGPPQDTYIASCLSVLPADSRVLWDEYYKVGRLGSGSPLRLVLSRPALRWAWYVALGTLILFVAFSVKRRQRAIPLAPLPANTSVEFAETIGRLYFQHGDHAGLARKMLLYLKDFIRKRLYLSVQQFSEAEAAELAEKSGLDADWVRRWFAQCRQAQQAERLEAEQLERLHQSVRQFYEAFSQRVDG